MIKKTPLYFFLLFIIAAVFSCKHEIPSIPVVVVHPIDTIVCFENDVLPIFQSYCAKSGCHDSINAAENFIFNSYPNIVSHWINPGDAAGSRVFQLLEHDNPNRMPIPPNDPLTNDQIDLIARWINQGAKNTTGCAPVCDSSNFTYSSGVQPILQTNCLGCHGGNAEAGNYIILDNYEAVKEQVTENFLLASVTHSGAVPPMPQNSAKLTDCKIAIIRKWIEAGALNN